jgi:hypothetical protein
MKERKQWVVEPWWEWPSFDILGTKDEAKKKYQQITAMIGQQTIIYKNGSGINGRVGAAAVTLGGGLMESAYFGKGNRIHGLCGRVAEQPHGSIYGAETYHRQSSDSHG